MGRPAHQRFLQTFSRLSDFAELQMQIRDLIDQV